MSEEAESDSVETEESTPKAVRPSPLRTYVKEHNENFLAGGDAIDLLRDHLEQLAGDIWDQGAYYAQQDDRETVQEQDIRQAYQDIMEPHDLIFQAAADLEQMKSRLEDTGGMSPIATDDYGQTEEDES